MSRAPREAFAVAWRRARSSPARELPRDTTALLHAALALATSTGPQLRAGTIHPVSSWPTTPEFRDRDYLIAWREARRRWHRHHGTPLRLTEVRARRYRLTYWHAWKEQHEGWAPYHVGSTPDGAYCPSTARCVRHSLTEWRCPGCGKVFLSATAIIGPVPKESKP